MNNLFMPKEQRDLDDLVTGGSYVKSHINDEVIFFNDLREGKIMTWSHVDGFNEFDDRYEMREFYFDGKKLYDSGPLGIKNTLTGEVVAEPKNSITAICEHEGDIYYGTYTGKIFNLDDPKKPLVDRGNTVFSLVSFDGNLYDAGDYSKIYKNIAFRVKGNPFNKVHDMLVCDDDILVAGDRPFVESLYGGRKFDFIDQDSDALSLFYYDHEVHYLDDQRNVYRLDTQEQLMRIYPYFAEEMVAVPRRLLGGKDE